MGPEFIYRTVKVSVALSLLGFLFVSRAFGFGFGVGFLAGGLWSALNLWLLVSLLTSALAKEKNKKKILLLFMLKFPVLYGGGFFLVWYGRLNVLGVLVGFSLPLVVAVLKAAGRQLQQNASAESSAGRTGSESDSDRVQS